MRSVRQIKKGNSMKRMEEIIKLLTPPVMISLYRWLKERNKKMSFSGVYNSIDDIHNENPWIQNRWIELSKNKLQQIGKLSQDSFMPTSDFGGYNVLPCLIINLLSQDKPCHILDYGGGTGYIYFKILPYLLNPKNVTWHVVDITLELLQIGKKHAMSMDNGGGIVFHTEIPPKGDIQLDILYINSAFQYMYDYSSLLVTLLQYKPQYVILTRLIAGDMKTYITCHYAHGYIPTPCILINFQEIVEIFSKNGFNLVFKSPCPEEVFEGKFDKNIPKHLHIQNASNLIFRRFD